MEKGRLETGFFVVLLAAALALTALILRPSLGAIVLAIILAVLFRPAYLRLLKFLRWESAAALATVLLVLLLVLAPLSILGQQIFTEARHLYDNLAAGGGNNLGQAFNDFLARNLARFGLTPANLNVNEYARQGANWLIQNLGPLFSGVAQVLISLLLGMFGFYYLLKDGPALRDRTVELIPLEPSRANQVLQKMEQAITSIVRGVLAMAFIQGIVAGIGFTIFGLPSPALWGTLTAFAALVPTLGTSLVIGPAVLYLFFFGSATQAVGLLVWGAVAVGMIDNFLAPQLMRRGMKVHPFLILLSVLGGIAVFGPLGILAGPLSVALFLALLEIYPAVIANRAT